MYTRISKTGGRQYLQLVESFRNDSGKVRTRVVANLGRLDQISPTQLDPLINGLNRAIGRAENTASEVIQEPGLAFGNVFALHELWRDFGIDTALKRAMRSSRRDIDAEALIRAMVFNRLCAPDSKLGCLRWLDTVAMPAMPETVTHQHLLRAMDALMDHAEAVEGALPRHAHAAEGQRPHRQPPHCARPARPHPETHRPYRHPHLQRHQQNNPGATRPLRRPEPAKTSLTTNVVTQTHNSRS
jgi:hypothetical protein